MSCRPSSAPPCDGAIAADGHQHPVWCPDAGGRVVHALTLLMVLLVAAPLANHIPLCVLAAIF